MKIQVDSRHIPSGRRPQPSMDHLRFDGAEDAGYQGRKEQSRLFPPGQCMIAKPQAIDVTRDRSHNDLLPVLVVDPRAEHQSRSMFQAGYPAKDKWWFAGSQSDAYELCLRRSNEG